MRLVRVVFCGALAAGGPVASSSGQAAPPETAGAAKPETRTVVAGKEFDRGGNWRFWFGDGYRKAWTTPVALPVLDLKTEAGGLTPLRQIGGFQTEGLAMKGADGHGYTFRKLEKHPERVLPKEWQESELRAVAIDQTSAAHPAATAIVGSLAQSVGIPFYGSRLAVMPDDPALGEFRQSFGGTVGTFDEYLGPGTRGITEVISTFDLWKKWKEDGLENRVDARAFLKARLFDLVVGNWDRHQAQWRWARFGSEPVWVPLPEDADQAFTRYEGKAMGAVRRVVPRFMRYSGEYPKRMEGLTTNNYDVTRWLLTRLEWPVFEEVARELASQMTDAVIDEAMRQMPPEWYAIDGAQMTKDLRQRRDGIVAYARKFYEHLADPVDVRGTDRADLATVEHLGDGTLRLTLAPLHGDGTAGAAYYERRFLPKETDEIRLYLYGGDDRVVATGANKDGIHLRVLTGDGNDTVDDSQGGGLDVQDPHGLDVRRGPGTKVSDHEWKNPAPEPDRPWLEPRNYGHWTVPMVAGLVAAQPGVDGRRWRDAHGVGLPPVPVGEHAVLHAAVLDRLQQRAGDVPGPVAAQRHEPDRRRRRALLRDREHELLRFRERDRDDRRQGAVQDGDERVLDLPGAALPAGEALRAARRAGGQGRPDQGRRQPRGAAAGVRDRQVRPGRPPGRPRVRLARPRPEHDRGARDGGTGRHGGGGGASGERRADSGRELLRAEGLGRDRGLRRPRRQRRRLPRQPDAGARDPGRRARAVGPLPVVRVGQHLRAAPAAPGPTARCAATTTVASGATPRCTATRSCAGGSATARRGCCRCAGASRPSVESGRVWYEGEDSKKWHTGVGVGLLVQLTGTPMAFGGSMATGTEGLKFYFAGGYSF